MTAATIFRLVLLGLVFLIWAYLLVRMLARASAHPDGFGRGLGQYLRGAEDRRDRGTLFFMTFVLAAMIAMQAAIPGG